MLRYILYNIVFQLRNNYSFFDISLLFIRYSTGKLNFILKCNFIWKLITTARSVTVKTHATQFLGDTSDATVQQLSIDRSGISSKNVYYHPQYPQQHTKHFDRRGRTVGWNPDILAYLSMIHILTVMIIANQLWDQFKIYKTKKS